MVITRLAGNAGVAIVMVLMAITLFTSLGAVLVLTSSADVMIAAQFRDQRAAFYAAEAAVERALSDAAALPDWRPAIAGLVRSPFDDGPPGRRVLDDGRTIDLGEVVNIANCQKSSACTASDLNAVTDERPWGDSNPRWQLFAHGPLRDLLSAGPIDSPWYVVALVADDPLRRDRAIAIRGEAFGPRNGHVVVEMSAARADADSDYNGGSVVRTLSWREVR